LIRAVVFDLDGLMFDTEDLFFRVASEALAARGKAFTPEIMKQFIGRRASEVVQLWKTAAGVDDPVEDFLADVKTRFFAILDTVVHPTPGLFLLLDRLHHLAVPQAVATSSGHSYADRLLINHGIRNRFAFVLAAEDVKRGKPDPEIYCLAAARFGVAPQSMLVLEDSPAGIAAAKGAGALAVGVPHEHSPALGLSAADLVVARLDDPSLLQLIETRDETQRTDERPH
jgi:beta-phosphoglucomutase-like phosphatase (HAD superfamily)